MRLSILDQAPIAEGMSGGTALWNSVDMAVHADGLGFHRFWLAEHHATPALASASPELLLAAIGQRTGRIRIGTGGIMLPHYSPFKVAESFSMLAGMFPGRIDLGLGRAPGSDPLTAFALQQDRRARAAHDFPGQLTELLGHLGGGFPPDHPFGHLGATLPGGMERPEVWILGSSPDSAALAGALGLRYCIADFIAGAVPELAQRYRATFCPSERLKQPYVMVAAWLTCAPSETEARYRAGPARMMLAELMAGRLIAVPDPEVAQRWLSAHSVPSRPGHDPIVGDPAQCRQLLLAKAAIYGADEMMLVGILHDHGHRLQGHELIAEAMAQELAAVA